MPPIISYRTKLKSRAKYLRMNSTKAERLLWFGLKNKRLLGLQFQRQKMIDNYIIDFYCKKFKLGIELDGETHEGKFEYDQQRTNKLKRFGIKILRFSNLDVLTNPDGAIEIIRRFITDQNPPLDPLPGGETS
jgi:very-short-patch-repair endonuclease